MTEQTRTLIAQAIRNLQDELGDNRLALRRLDDQNERIANRLYHATGIEVADSNLAGAVDELISRYLVLVEHQEEVRDLLNQWLHPQEVEHA